MLSWVTWVSPVTNVEILCERFKLIGGRKRGTVLGSCAVVVVFLGYLDRKKH